MDETLHKLQALYNESAVLMAAFDSFDRLRFANQAFRSAFFLKAEESPFWGDLMRRNYRAQRGTVIRHHDFEAWLLSAQSRRGKTGYRAFETDLVDGRWLWMTETVERDGWMLCVAADITHLKADERSLRQDRDQALKASNTDELTGVANRRFVTARIDEMLRRPMPSTEPGGCVCVIDLDNFKYINDRFGHPAGDLILKDFAVRIQRQVRRTDCFGRVGGEEFMLVLPNTASEETALIVDRMLSMIRRSRPLRAHKDFSYTFSAGIAASTTGEAVSALIARADRALYAAKMAGRNRIEIDRNWDSESSIAG